MTTYSDYTDILLHICHFLPQILKIKESKIEFHFHHKLHVLFDFDMLHP
jgi:hypothetical protein